MNTAHDLRLVPAALGAYGAAAALVAGVDWALVGAALVAVSAAGLVVRGGAWRTTWLLSCAATAVVAIVAMVHLETRWTGGIDGALNQDPVLITGVLVRDSEPIAAGLGMEGSRFRVAVAVDGWQQDCACPVGERDRQWIAARAHVTVVGDGQWQHMAFGSRVVVRGRLQDTTSPRDIAVVWGAELLDHRSPTGSARAVGSLRDGLRKATAHLPDDVRGLTRGMVIGDTTDMPVVQRDHMRETSLAHLTAVSGAHFAIVLMATAGSLRLLGWDRRVRAVIAAVIMAGFATLVFPEPSVLRASTMAGTVCVALWWGRPAHAMPALAAGVLLLMTADPYLSLSFGFALSVTAVTAIVMWAPVIAQALQRWVTPAMAKAISVPLAAQVACAPILILLNPGFGVYGIAANLIATVFAVPVTLLGVVAVVVAPVSTGAAAAIATVAGMAAYPIAAATAGFAQAPGAWVAWPSGWWGAALMAVLSCAVIVASSATRWRALWRLATVAVAALLIVSVPSVRDTAGLGPAPMPDWHVVVCDVGQGHMMMLRAGEHAAVVIDVGSAGNGAVECLRRHRVRDIPLLILTHPHEDHDGAAADVAHQTVVGEVWVSAAGAQPATSRALDAVLGAGVPARVPSQGDTVTVGAVTLEVWQSPPVGANLNDASLVIAGTAGPLTFVNLGDLEEAGQAALARSLVAPVPIDVAMVAHHGSASQHAPLVESLPARVAVVGVGEGNRHGHPAASALELYASTGASVWRTDLCGDVVIGLRGAIVVAAPCEPLVAG